MVNPESEFKSLEIDIDSLIDEEFKNNAAILAMNIGTHGGSIIANKQKKDFRLTKLEIASATSSLLFLSSKMLKSSLNQKISHNLIAGKETILLSILTDYITMNVYLTRELADLEGINNYVNSLKRFALKISAIIETSDIIKEEIFVAIKRAIPNTLVLAIITKDGLPIKIQSTMAEPMISAMISALYSLSDVLLEEEVEFSIIAGENGSIIIHELDENRIVCVAVPEADESKLGSYIVKIKSIIKENG